MICVDGGSGLIAALPMVYDKIPVQRRWPHKIRNVLNKVRNAEEKSVKADLHAIMNADTATKARSAPAASPSAGAKPTLPPSPVCPTISTRLLTCFRYKTLVERKAVRTTNAIERRFREVRRRTHPMGVFQDRTSMDRILFAVFTHENKTQRIPTFSPWHKTLDVTFAMGTCSHGLEEASEAMDTAGRNSPRRRNAAVELRF